MQSDFCIDDAGDPLVLAEIDVIKGFGIGEEGKTIRFFDKQQKGAQKGIDPPIEQVTDNDVILLVSLGGDINEGRCLDTEIIRRSTPIRRLRDDPIPIN